jgi:hypothetical protein
MSYILLASLFFEAELNVKQFSMFFYSSNFYSTYFSSTSSCTSSFGAFYFYFGG